MLLPAFDMDSFAEIKIHLKKPIFHTRMVKRGRKQRSECIKVNLNVACINFLTDTSAYLVIYILEILLKQKLPVNQTKLKYCMFLSCYMHVLE